MRYKKSIPVKGPSSAVLAAGLIAFMAGGWYLLIRDINRRNDESIEVNDIRISILPFLQAEEDQRQVEIRAVLDAKERELMQDVKDWEVSKPVFNTVDWVRPKGLPYP